MEWIPAEIWWRVLGYCGERRGILRTVCRLWRDLIELHLSDHANESEKKGYGTKRRVAYESVELYEYSTESLGFRLDPIGDQTHYAAAGARSEVLKIESVFKRLKSVKLTAELAGYGGLGTLQYCHENGCPWNERTCIFAAWNGHLECLKYAHENGCPWDEWTCTNAAENGRLECLKYAHEQGCTWNERTCTYAAWNGHLECLKYAHENGCPWDKWTCTYATGKGQLECLKYAHEHGCPWTAETMNVAKTNKHEECVKYCTEHGCPE